MEHEAVRRPFRGLRKEPIPVSRICLYLWPCARHEGAGYDLPRPLCLTSEREAILGREVF
jgi:hypothetical protein